MLFDYVSSSEYDIDINAILEVRGTEVPENL